MHHDAVEIQAIPAGQAQTFRHRVLQPHEEKHSVYDLDDAAATLHVGAFVNGSLAAVATICPEPMPNNGNAKEWRLRGMATLDHHRGKGLGKRLTKHCLAHAVSQGGSLVWCSARVSAIGFYRSLGFAENRGETFSLPEYSHEQYVLMLHSLPQIL